MQHQYTYRTTKYPATYTIPLKGTAPQYTYQYTYHYEWLRTPENVTAQCRVNSDDRVMLTNSRLKVKIRQQLHTFFLKQVESIDFTPKKLMLPILTGGIVTPLSLLAIFSGILTNWVGMSLLIVGGMLFYYGYRGAYQLTIKCYQQPAISFFIDDETPALKQLLQLTRKQIYRLNLLG